MRIRILPEAERDLDVGAEFYESQAPGAGARFIRGLLADIDRLAMYGGVHARHRGFLRAIAHRFPFAIFYDITGDVIDVYAVLDCRQDPAAIESRLDARGDKEREP